MKVLYLKWIERCAAETSCSCVHQLWCDPHLPILNRPTTHAVYPSQCPSLIVCDVHACLLYCTIASKVGKQMR